ncbi:MAG TPA: ATP-binding cassette domain-containing protein [Polyangiaceae bacterium]
MLAIDVDGLTKTFRTRRAAGTTWLARARGIAWPSFDDALAVDRVSFSIREGERVAFIGPNGAGKSTTLKILSGILFPDSGKAEVLGRVPWHDRQELAFSIGTVFGQRSQLWYHLPPRETFALLGHVYELDPKTTRRRLDLLVSAFDLEALLDRPVRQLSLGERMRCEIAASLLHEPRVLFLDEPTIGLDVAAKAVIRELLQARSQQDGSTLLLTSHDTGDIERVCERAIVIHRGRVLSDGPLSDLRRGHLNTKRLTFWSDNAALTLALPGVRTIATLPYETRVEVELDVTPLGVVIDAALKQGTLRDLRIDDPPLDDVIRALYARAEGSIAA